MLTTTSLVTTFDQEPLAAKLKVYFVVVDYPSSYNLLTGRSALVELDVIIFYNCLIMKFLVQDEVDEIKGR